MLATIFPVTKHHAHVRVFLAAGGKRRIISPRFSREMPRPLPRFSQPRLAAALRKTPTSNDLLIRTSPCFLPLVWMID